MMKKLMDFNSISNEAIEIKVITERYLEEYAESIMDKEFIRKNRISIPNGITKEKLIDRLKMYINSQKALITLNKKRYIICDCKTQEFIGGITVFIIDEHTLVLGYWIIKKFRGNGYGYSALSLMSDTILHNLKNVDRLKLSIFNDNIESQGLAIKCGYRLCKEENNILEYWKYSDKVGEIHEKEGKWESYRYR